MIYIFHRADGLYPSSLPNDGEAIAVAEASVIAVIKVTDSENRVVFDADEKTCDRCNGSGEIAAMTHGHGPDDYEVPANCPKCNGTGIPSPTDSSINTEQGGGG